MPVLYLTDPCLRVSLEGDYLEVRSDAPDTPPLRRVPLTRLEQLVADAGVDLPLSVAASLAARGISTLITRRDGAPVASVTGLDLKAGVRLAQGRAFDRPDFCVSLARTTLAAKLKNQRRLLQRSAAHRGADYRRPPALATMDELIGRVGEARTLETLRGLEGLGANAYFAAFEGFFPAEMPFHGRNRRPPKDPVNATLSLLYAMVTGEIVLALRAAGLDPGRGFLHVTEDGRPSLALDLIEPFRPAIADALTLDLVNHRRLREEHFTLHPETGCRLNAPGRKVLFAAYEEKMTRTFLDPDSGEKTCFRNRIRAEAYALRRSLVAVPDSPENGYRPFLSA